MQILTFILILWLRCTKPDSVQHDSEILDALLTNKRLQFDDMLTSYIPIPMLNSELWPNSQLSLSDKYDSFSKYPSKMSFNSLISKDEIEIILSENDIELTSQLTDGFEKQLSKTLNHINLDRYWQFVSEMSGTKLQKLKTKSIKDYPPFNMNGASSDYRYIKSKTPSTGINGEYWTVSDQCIKHKGCNVYPIFRVIHKSKSYSSDNKYLSFSCEDILTILLPQIYECIDKYGLHKCPLIIDSGHFRWVFKVKIPNTNDYIVIKMMKQTSKEKPRDLLRHLRESIFLYYLRKQEIEYMEKYPNKIFISNLNEKRAFPYVHELGHCLYPHYISISHYYNMTIEKFIEKRYTLKTNISQLIKMSLGIAQGIELLHNIYGGPYHHTDIRDDQFMIDNYGNILINDFNRGKFQPYYFPKYDYNKTGGVERCNFCPHQANGVIRAPEEQIMRNLDETIDIYSAAFIIWNLFSIDRPFQNIRLNNENIKYLIYDTVRRPSMPSNMPYALKDIIRAALSQNPNHRPNAKEFRKIIQYIYKHLDRYTRKKSHLEAGYAREHKMFHDAHYPRVSKDFPEFKGKSGDT
eukprot:479952_1